MRADDVERFWSKVDRSAGPEGCWPFAGRAAVRAGHRQMSLNGRMVLAHRIAYTLASGEDPEGMVVRHTCDNPPCCNPAHLAIGTQADNVQDRDRRGRTVTLSGAAHPNAKLTDSDVRAIRGKHTDGATASALAAKYGVCLSTICRIVKRQSWVST